jgi:hypothetical protein
MSEQVLSRIEVEGLLKKQEERFEQKIKNVENRAGFKVNAIDYNPETKFTYISDGVSIPPLYDNPLMDHDKWMGIYHPNAEQKKALAAGTFDKDREEDCYTDEHRGLYQEFKSQLNNAMKTHNNALASSVITSMDFGSLTTNINITKVIAFQLVDSVLEQAATTQQTPNLKASYRTWTGLEVQTNVPEGVIVEAKKGSLSEKSFTVKKDVGAAAITIEGELVLPLTVANVFGETIQQIAVKMRDARANKLAAALAAVNYTGAFLQTGADMGPHTGGVSTNDPGDMFLTTLATLAANGYTLNTIISGMKPKREYFVNSWIKGQFAVGPAVNRAPRIFAGVPGIETAPTWYADAKITTDTILYALDKQVFVYFEGPKRQVEIQRPDAEVREYYTRDFNTPYIVDTNGIVKITGVTA